MFNFNSNTEVMRKNIFEFSNDITSNMEKGMSFIESLATYLLENDNFDGAYFTFLEAQKLYPNSTYTQTHLKSLEALKLKIENGPFYNKKYVITGTLENMERNTALGLIDLFGGRVSDSPVNDMNILVVGYCEWSEMNNGKPSRKIVKAKELQNSGKDIQIISDKEFILSLKEIARKIFPNSLYEKYFDH